MQWLVGYSIINRQEKYSEEAIMGKNDNKKLTKEFSKNVLKRWVKDYSLPIKIFEEPYFSYLIDLYDEHLNTIEKLDKLRRIVSNFSTDDEYLTHNNNLTEKIVGEILNVEAYKEFNTKKMDEYNISSQYPKKDIYKKENVDKTFISIDLVKANYQALKYIDSSIVFNTNNYNEFIKKFTDYDYIVESKYIRQVIFGRLNPKRQIKVARYLIEKVIEHILESNLLNEEAIAMASSDEVIFELNDDNLKALLNLHEKIREEIKSKLNIDVDIEIFTLKDIEDGAYVKEFLNKDGYQFACAPQIYYPQIFKLYNNMELNDMDLVFKHEGRLAKFIEPIA